MYLAGVNLIEPNDAYFALAVLDKPDIRSTRAQTSIRTPLSPSSLQQAS